MVRCGVPRAHIVDLRQEVEELRAVVEAARVGRRVGGADEALRGRVRVGVRVGVTDRVRVRVRVGLTSDGRLSSLPTFQMAMAGWLSLCSWLRSELLAWDT